MQWMKRCINAQIFHFILTKFISGKEFFFILIEVKSAICKTIENTVETSILSKSIIIERIDSIRAAFQCKEYRVISLDFKSYWSFHSLMRSNNVRQEITVKYTHVFAVQFHFLEINFRQTIKKKRIFPFSETNRHVIKKIITVEFSRCFSLRVKSLEWFRCFSNYSRCNVDSIYLNQTSRRIKQKKIVEWTRCFSYSCKSLEEFQISPNSTRFPFCKFKMALNHSQAEVPILEPFSIEPQFLERGI